MSFSSIFMAPLTPAQSSEPRPGTLRTSRSFPRPAVQETTIDPLTRAQRASTFQNGTTPEIKVIQTSPKKENDGEGQKDTFETAETAEPMEPPRASVDIEDIPIELISLTDNFIDGLSAKVNAVPPNIDNLSRRFQDFYATASHHIQTHIDSLASRQSRYESPRPAAPSRASTASILRAKAASLTGKDKPKPASTTEGEQQMLTAEELANRKKARIALEQKKVLLEEGVERRLCEGIYDRIYRHKSTHDTEADEKLRSKTAALGLVGIGLAELGLGVKVDEDSEDDTDAALQKQEEIRQYLEQARKNLTTMHEKRYPLGKLNYLKAAQKSIVDTLSHFQLSSSADEIMPLLIYTLITMPPEKLDVISDLKFIQRFRWEEKLDGESTYCLTNLEAAILFLDTVDLASLRADESLTGPAKLGSMSGSPRTETFPPAYTPGISEPTQSAASLTPTEAQGSKAPPSPTTAKALAQRRRLSDLIQTPAQAIGNARDSFFDTADQSFKNISNSLGDSYNFFIGRLRDTTDSGKELIVPRTLDDARKLIGTPPPEDPASLDGSIPVQGRESGSPAASRDDKILHLVGGRKVPRDRDRSTDSTRSGRSASSSKKVVFANEEREKAGTPVSVTGASSSSNPALVDQMRNLTNTFNPMNRLASMSMIRGFGRTTPTPTAPAKDAPPPGKPMEGGDLASQAFPDIAPSLPPKDIPQINGPNKRFMELQNPADLKLGEVLELLRDYRRLANALKERDAFKEN
ncbi:VPS9 domain-containingprotein [Apiospora marii]|uniref:VPS9 domain-containingprotein n=1 Tax=Apiospora marii TaxID=335849 RepID=A0ABR1S545_9PEZI